MLSVFHEQKEVIIHLIEINITGKSFGPAMVAA
jgi:hypothetical protein